MQCDAIWRQHGVKLDVRHFAYKLAKAQEEHYPDGNKEVRKVIVLEASDKETGVKFQYELDAEPNVHVLFIGNKNPKRPAGFYKTKKVWCGFATGRSRKMAGTQLGDAAWHHNTLLA